MPNICENVSLLPPIVSEKNRFQTQKISAIVGHFDVTMAMLADDLGIPYLVTSSPQQTTWPHHNFTFYMLPPPGIVHSAVKDIVDAYRWRESAVLYDDDTGLHFIYCLIVSNTCRTIADFANSKYIH